MIRITAQVVERQNGDRRAAGTSFLERCSYGCLGGPRGGLRLGFSLLGLTPRLDELAGRSRPGAFKNADPGGVMLLGFGLSTVGGEQPDQGCASAFVHGRQSDEILRMRDCRRRVVRQAGDESAKNIHLQGACRLPLPCAPSLEVAAVGQVQPLKEFPPERGGRLLQRLGGRFGDRAPMAFTHCNHIDCGLRQVQCYGVTIRYDARMPGLVEQRPELAEAPPQGPSWVVGDVPKNCAQAVTALAPPGYRQVGKEGAGLARVRQRNRRAVTNHLRFTQKIECEHLIPRRHRQRYLV